MSTEEAMRREQIKHRMASFCVLHWIDPTIRQRAQAQVFDFRISSW